MKNSFFWILFCVFPLVFLSCSKDNDEEGPSQSGVSVVPEQTHVNTFQIVHLKVTGSVRDMYQGTMGSEPVELMKTEDSILSFFVPNLPQGQAVLKFELAEIPFQVSQTTPESVQDWIATIDANMEEQIDRLDPNTQDFTQEVQEMRDYRKEVMELFESLSEDEQQQALLFY